MKRLRITVEGKAYEVEVELLDEGAGESRSTHHRPKAASARAAAPVAAPAPTPKAAPAAAGDGAVVAPLSAVVVSVNVEPGASVTEGQTVIVLEAMKMNTVVVAPAAGTVGAVQVKVGDAVEEGQVLLTLA